MIKNNIIIKDLKDIFGTLMELHRAVEQWPELRPGV